MKAFQHKLSDPLPELHDHHIFEEREARRDKWDEKAEHERDLEYESRLADDSWNQDKQGENL